MTPVQILFLVISALLLVSAFMVVTVRNLVRAALWLIAALFMVGVVFVLLDAGFMAVVQVVVYIGAIAILFIFAVMLTRRVMADTGPQTNSGWAWAAFGSTVLFGGLAWMLWQWQSAGATPLPTIPPGMDTVTTLGAELVNPAGFLIPFEVASVLLLAALIGAIVVAWDRS
jgi:NADH-quinone oxidoreductase subunit J